MTKSVRVSEEESACVRGRMRCCQRTDLCADCSLLRSCLCSHLSHQAFQRVSFLYFLALAHLAWQPSCWQVLGFLVLFFFVVIFVNAGTWIHCVLGDVLHCLTLLIQEKKNTFFIFIVEESLKVFTELFWVQENWEQTPSSLTSDFLQRSIRDFLPVAVWRCWQVKHTMANNFQSFSQSKYSFINMHTELSVSLPSLLRDTEGERWVFFCLLANQEWCLVHS